MRLHALTQKIKKKALDLGFFKIGIAEAIFYKQDRDKFYSWLDNNYHASMDWLSRRKDERTNIKNYFYSSKSVISLAINYHTGHSWKENELKISNYALGDDYHLVVKSKLYSLLKYIKKEINDVKGLVCVDTSPIMEKAWAQRAGIGWIGKHTNLITRERGSWFFLGEIIIDKKLEFDFPYSLDLCGTCTSCMDSCPTGALNQEYVLDSSKCISYYTIEHRKDDISEDIYKNFKNWIYGCDICQEVCPWNTKKNLLTNINEFLPRKDLIEKNKLDWIELSNDEYKRIFKNSTIKRAKFNGIKRNIRNVTTTN